MVVSSPCIGNVPHRSASNEPRNGRLNCAWRNGGLVISLFYAIGVENLPLKNHLVIYWHRYEGNPGIFYGAASFGRARVGIFEGNQDRSSLVKMPECFRDKFSWVLVELGVDLGPILYV